LSSGRRWRRGYREEGLFWDFFTLRGRRGAEGKMIAMEACGGDVVAYNDGYVLSARF